MRKRERDCERRKTTADNDTLCYRRYSEKELGNKTYVTYIAIFRVIRESGDKISRRKTQRTVAEGEEEGWDALCAPMLLGSRQRWHLTTF